MMRRVVSEADEHASSIRQWLNDVIIGYNFCPYARPAADADQIRIVTSSADKPEGVLDDLTTEAMRLPVASQAELESGQPATTLLVCPHVAAWQSFEEFRSFYDMDLSKGYIFAEQDLYIVCFHPRYGEGSDGVEDGDEIDLGGVAATVLDSAAGFGASGQPLAKVAMASGEEAFIELPTPIDETEELVSTAPRPALHLLRTRDLEEANDAEIHRRNTDTIADLGALVVRERIRQCE